MKEEKKSGQSRTKPAQTHQLTVCVLGGGGGGRDIKGEGSEGKWRERGDRKGEKKGGK